MQGAEYENARRQQAKRVENAWGRLHKVPVEDQDAVMIDQSQMANKDLINGDIDEKRFEEILQHLVEHHRQLALDTMHLKVGEHVLLAHVIRSGLNTRHEEFRAFLKRCHRMKKYLRYAGFDAFRLVAIY